MVGTCGQNVGTGSQRQTLPVSRYKLIPVAIGVPLRASAPGEVYGHHDSYLRLEPNLGLARTGYRARLLSGARLVPWCTARGGRRPWYTVRMASISSHVFDASARLTRTLSLHRRLVIAIVMLAAVVADD